MGSGSKKTGDEEVGRRIAERRTRLQMSRDDLAREIGASYALVAQIETGWRMPSYEKQLLIAKALGARLDELFGATDDEPLSLTEDDRHFPFDGSAGGVPWPEPAQSGPAFAPAASAFPLGAIPVRRAAAPASARSAPLPSVPPPPTPTPRPTFDEAVERAAAALRDLPPSRRLDALARLQLSVTREVVDDERRRLGSDRQPSGWITDLKPNEVFVFGSSADGRHGAGAARTAFERFGAEWGEGSGHHGQSYAIVTMSGLGVLRDQVAEFVRYAARHLELRFLVTPIGTGTAGYRADEIAYLFEGAPANVVLPMEFEIAAPRT
ncbi:helix-turn-helix domain-containing protein [Microbacterium sp. SS28]|uniref:A1S_2505 family phage non-structural protein n=1 Tax=Microbacterium sp. SS28 TaxID=2919948 RepID=UPI001FAABDEC|nr:helix-turn-helix domain-containing protein [Microbacterium sp. SS28]